MMFVTFDMSFIEPTPEFTVPEYEIATLHLGTKMGIGSQCARVLP